MLKKEEKTNCVFVHGIANAGKTSFLKILTSILICTNYKQTKSNFDCKYKHGKTAPHFMVVEECGIGKIFDPKDHYANAKLLCEG